MSLYVSSFDILYILMFCSYSLLLEEQARFCCRQEACFTPRAGGRTPRSESGKRDMLKGSEKLSLTALCQQQRRHKRPFLLGHQGESALQAGAGALLHSKSGLQTARNYTLYMYECIHIRHIDIQTLIYCQYNGNLTSLTQESLLHDLIIIEKQRTTMQIECFCTGKVTIIAIIQVKL